jgi:hypothetical protein
MHSGLDGARGTPERLDRGGAAWRRGIDRDDPDHPLEHGAQHETEEATGHGESSTLGLVPPNATDATQVAG